MNKQIYKILINVEVDVEDFQFSETSGRERLFGDDLEDITVVAVNTGILKDVHDELQEIVNVLIRMINAKPDAKLNGENREHGEGCDSNVTEGHLDVPTKVPLDARCWIVDNATSKPKPTDTAKTGARFDVRVAVNEEIHRGVVALGDDHGIDWVVVAVLHDEDEDFGEEGEEAHPFEIMSRSRSKAASALTPRVLVFPAYSCGSVETYCCGCAEAAFPSDRPPWASSLGRFVCRVLSPHLEDLASNSRVAKSRWYLCPYGYGHGFCAWTVGCLHGCTYDPLYLYC